MEHIFPLAFIADDDIPDWITVLQKQKKVIAPQKVGTQSYSFDVITHPNQVELDYHRTLSSIKKYFLPQKEVLFSYALDGSNIQSEDVQPVDAIFLGVHNYDLQSLFRLDYNFSSGHAESQYLIRRQKSLFIGVSYIPDKWHFSGSVIPEGHPNQSDGFDLFLHRVDGGYILETLSEEGRALLKGWSFDPFLGEVPKPTPFKSELIKPFHDFSSIFSDSWDSPVWNAYAEKCVGCGTCNLVCPTCFCFDVHDEVELDLHTGKRVRTQDGCMVRSFSEVAGGEIFREQKASRMRHRIYRKFKYISQETGDSWCIGCGRCSAYCTAGISIVDIVNELILESKSRNIES